MTTFTAKSVKYARVPGGGGIDNSRLPRRPRLLDPLVWWSFIASLVTLGAISIALTCYSENNAGLFTNTSGDGDRDDVLRFIWTSGPACLMTVVESGILFPMAQEIYLVVPYAELEKPGGATVEESLMANYATVGMLARITSIVRNKKWGLLCLAISGFLGLGLNITAAGLIGSGNVNISVQVPVQVTGRLGLEPVTDATNGHSDDAGNYLFLSTYKYYAAALFAGGQQLYRPSPPPFTFWNSENNWSITPFTLPSESKKRFISKSAFSSAATVTIETYGVNANANCKIAESITFGTDNVTTATLGGCSYTFPVQGLEQPTNPAIPYDRWHAADSMKCQDSAQSDFAFNAFMYLAYRPRGYTARDPTQFVVVFCRPTITASKISATLNISHDGAIGSLIEPPRLISSDGDDPNIAPLLFPPLNGMAVNGYNIAQTKGLVRGAPGSSRITRANGTREILAEGIYAAIHASMGQDDLSSSSTDWFTETNRTKMAGIISEFYQAYLNAFAPDIYYDTSGPATMQLASIRFPVTRAQVSPLHGIGLAILLFLLAIFMTGALRLQAVPNPQSPVWGFSPATILKHVSMSTTSLFNHLSTDIDSKDSDGEIITRLRDRRYASDNGTFIVLPNPAGNQTAPHAPPVTPDRPSNLGWQEEALPVIQEAVGLCRRLAPDRPAAFDLDLAMSLNNVSIRLSNLGCREEALQAIQGLVELYRGLAADHPVIFNHNLAKSLDDLSLSLSNLGHREEALQAIQEAVGLYRRLAADHPVIFNHNLAKSLDDLFLSLSNLGHRGEALQAIQEAVELYRRLAADHPMVFNHNLARSLDNLLRVLSLSDLGHREEALQAIQEAVELYRRLATYCSGVAFDPCDFARSLNNLSSCLSGLGHEGEADVKGG